VIHNGQHVQLGFDDRVPKAKTEFYFNESSGFSQAEKDKIKVWLDHTYEYMKSRGLGTAQNASDGKVHVHLTRDNSSAPSGYAGGRAWNNPPNAAPEGHIFITLGNLSNRNESIMGKWTVEHEHIHLIQYKRSHTSDGTYGEERNFSDLEGMAEYWASNITMDNFQIDQDTILNVSDEVMRRLEGGADWFEFLQNIDTDYFDDFTSDIEYYWANHIFLRYIYEVFGEEKVRHIFRVRNLTTGIVGMRKAVNKALEEQGHNMNFTDVYINWTIWLWEKYRQHISLDLNETVNESTNVSENEYISTGETSYERISTEKDLALKIEFEGEDEATYAITVLAKKPDGTVVKINYRFNGSKTIDLPWGYVEIILIKRQISMVNDTVSEYKLKVTAKRPRTIPWHRVTDIPYDADPFGLSLTWFGGYPDIGDEVQYHYGISHDPGIIPILGTTEWMEYNHPPVTICPETHYPIDPNHDYFWTVYAEDRAGNFVEGPIFEFSTGAEHNQHVYDIECTPISPWGTLIDYTLTAVAADENMNDQIFYTIDWGDGTKDWWLGPYAVGEPCKAVHQWEQPGNYPILIMAKDSIGFIYEETFSEVQVLGDYCLNLVDFPMYDAYGPFFERMCGPAVAQMNLDYMWWDGSAGSPPTWSILNGWDQDDLYTYGHAENDNPDLDVLDAGGLYHVIQTLDPDPYSEYGYNFGIYHDIDPIYMIGQICKWIDYPAGIKPGHPLHVPGAVPAYGNYNNWVSVRGIHTDQPAYPMPPTLQVHGFWVNDPFASSIGLIGENSYKMIDQWLGEYYRPIMIEDDPYTGQFVAICEPPISEDCDLTIKHATEYWNLQPPACVKGGAGSSLLMQIIDRFVIYAAEQGVEEQLLPFDDDFAEVFEQSFAGRPILIKNLIEDKHDYYAVPFNNVPTLQPRKITEHSPPDDDITLVVVLVDATNGQFKEASWVHNPVDYLSLSDSDAIDVVFEELMDLGYNPDELNIREIQTSLVYRDSTPYYPDWRVVIDELGMEFFVSQDGTIAD